MSRLERIAELVRTNRVGVVAGLAFAVLAVLGIRWIVSANHEAPVARKPMQVAIVNLQAPPPKPPPPPPAPVPPPKVEDEPQARRVDLDPAEIPPDAPRPDASEPAPGPLALAAEGEGPGDAFQLAGNPGGKGLLSGGGIGDGTGTGVGGTGSGNRFAWYYVKVAADLEEAFRRHKRMSSASARVELRVWTDAAGRISRVQLIRSTGDLELDQAIQSVVGLKLREPPPRDIPMPMIARLTARRPE
jgi:periplasmic protein TonB